MFLFDDILNDSSIQIERFQLGMVYQQRFSVLFFSVFIFLSVYLYRFFRVSGFSDRYGFESFMVGIYNSVFSVIIFFIVIFISYSQAVKEKCWQQAMQEELCVFEVNKIWEVVDCFAGVILFECKWVYFIKVKSDGNLDRYKVRLVVFGNNQEYGMNYDEIFVPVVKMIIIRIILVIAVF